MNNMNADRQAHRRRDKRVTCQRPPGPPPCRGAALWWRPAGWGGELSAGAGSTARTASAGQASPPWRRGPAAGTTQSYNHRNTRLIYPGHWYHFFFIVIFLKKKKSICICQNSSSLLLFFFKKKKYLYLSKLNRLGCWLKALLNGMYYYQNNAPSLTLKPG